jgi:hypothetical protein
MASFLQMVSFHQTPPSFRTMASLLQNHSGTPKHLLSQKHSHGAGSVSDLVRLGFVLTKRSGAPKHLLSQKHSYGAGSVSDLV